VRRHLGCWHCRAMIATPSEPLTILTFASSNYLHWLAHLHRNVEQLQLRDASLLACTADDASLAAAHSKGLATIDVRDTAGCGLCSLLKINATGLSADSVSKDEGETWGTTTYTQIVHAKSVCVHLHVERHEGRQGLLLFVDTDVTLFSDPRSHFNGDADIALLLDIGPGVSKTGSQSTGVTSGRQELQPECWHFNASESSDGNSYLNSGFFLMRYTPVMRQLWRQMLHYHTDNPKVMQQAALNTLLKNDSHGRRQNSHITWHGLDPRRFLSGYCFYEQLPMHAYAAVPSPSRGPLSFLYHA